MIAEGELLFQLGIIMLLAFIGAAIANRFHQSAMLGYILVGVLIGPKISADLFGFHYEGLIRDVELVNILAQVGLVLLLFFIGLEFSISKLQKTKTPATILVLINLGVNMFAGFVIGTALGWPMADTFFLAGVIAVSSTAITAKQLIELRRMDNPETEFLIAFEIVGTFVAMLLLTVASGLVVGEPGGPSNLWELALGAAAFYAFFVWVAVWLMPRAMPYFERIRSEELFVLFALGVVFLASAVAAVAGVPPLIGAFFVGMIFAESKLTMKLEAKLESLKDAFVAIFFIAFGMLIDPAYFPKVLPIVLIAVPIVILNDVLLTGLLSYFIGFNSRAAVSIGTSICGRGEESVLYATVGSGVKVATRGAELVPFAGAFCFVMSSLAPFLMRRSAGLARALGRLMPTSAKFSGAVVSRTLSKLVLPASLPLFSKAKRTGVALGGFIVAIIATIVTTGWWHLVAVGVGLLVVAILWRTTAQEVEAVVRHANYSNLGVNSMNKRAVTLLTSRIIVGALTVALAIAALWTYYWPITLVAFAGYFIYCLWAMSAAFHRLHREEERAPIFATRAQALVAATPHPPVYGTLRGAPRRRRRFFS